MVEIISRAYFPILILPLYFAVRDRGFRDKVGDKLMTLSARIGNIGGEGSSGSQFGILFSFSCFTSILGFSCGLKEDFKVTISFQVGSLLLMVTKVVFI